MTTKVTGSNKDRIVGIVEAYMECDLNADAVEVYAAYYTNTYAVRVDEDTHFVVNGNVSDPIDAVEEVEFTVWPPHERG